MRSTLTPEKRPRTLRGIPLKQRRRSRYLPQALARQRPGQREIRISYRSGQYYNIEPGQFARRAASRRRRVRLYQRRGGLVMDLPAATEAVVPKRPLPWPAGPHLG